MPKLPISKTQLDKLGDRLRDADTPSEADLELLAQVLDVYEEALSAVRERLRGLGFEPAARLKSVPTLIDKLRRHTGASLRAVQDLAGARIVIDGRLAEQDRASESVVREFEQTGAPEKVVDRRVNPSSGYRAVHVIVKEGGLPVEIQIRTELQDLWAQVFERLGDAWGRAIRYGGDPEPAPDVPDTVGQRREIVAWMAVMSNWITDLEGAYERLRTPAASSANQHLQMLVALEDSVRATLALVGKMASERRGP